MNPIAFVDVSNLPENKQQEIIYFVKLMEKYPDLKIIQIVSAAKKYVEGPAVPQSLANNLRNLKLYFEKDKYSKVDI